MYKHNSFGKACFLISDRSCEQVQTSGLKRNRIAKKMANVSVSKQEHKISQSECLCGLGKQNQAEKQIGVLGDKVETVSQHVPAENSPHDLLERAEDTADALRFPHVVQDPEA